MLVDAKFSENLSLKLIFQLLHYLLLGKLQGSFNIYEKHYLYYTDLFCDNNFSLKVCKIVANMDVLFSIWGFGFCLSLFENNLAFIKVFVIY